VEPLKATQQMSEWQIEPHYSTVQFHIKHLFFFTVEGTFKEVTGSVRRNHSDLSDSRVEAVVKVVSLNTGNRKRDAHLLSADFFDAERFPEMRFESSKVEKGRDLDTLRVTGILTIKGQSHEVSFEAIEGESSRSPQGDEMAYYSAQLKFKRTDFGVAHSRGLIGEAVTVTVFLQALKSKIDKG
jgi:polyisoprenoid-binding protein YceI